MELKRIRLTDLELNKGQVAGLPSNPRQWTRGDLDKLIKSIEETPELLEARGLIVWPHGGKYIIMGGNMRFSALREMNAVDAPCYVLPECTSIDKLREIVVKDNGAFGAWDYDMLANEWDDLPLAEWGLPSWVGTQEEDVDILQDLTIETGSKAGENKSGFSAITFLFPTEEAGEVNAWISDHSKDELTAKILEICRTAEAK